MKTWATLLLLWAALASGTGLAEGAEKPALSVESRKREFASLQKDLEAVGPNNESTREEILTYVELAMDKYGKFARDNPRTVEGFEAAYSVALLLTQIHHPKTTEFAELAATSAPEAGVDVKRVAQCWSVVANGRVAKMDLPGVKAAIEKIKPLDNEMYEKMSQTFAEAEKDLLARKEAQARLQPGKAPFPIEETDVKGNPVSLASLKGKVVVIDFWATWCGPCMHEMPGLIKLYGEQHKNGLEIVGISADRNKAQLMNTLKEMDVTWPIVLDRGGSADAIGRKWCVEKIPSTYVLDRKGIIRHIDLRGEELGEAVVKLLGEKP